MLKKLMVLGLCAVPYGALSVNVHDTNRITAGKNTTTTFTSPALDVIPYEVLKATRQELIQNPLALHEACGNDNYAKAHILLAVGASVDARNNIGQTPLDCAARWNRVRIAELLLRYGALINSAGEGGWTPLHLAVAYKRQEMTKLLLQHGAFLHARITQGWVARPRVEREERMLIKKWGFLNDGFITVHHYAGETRKHIQEWTALHYAACKGYQEIMELLISKCFFWPTLRASTGIGTITLQDRCLATLLNHCHDFDEDSLKQQIVPCLAHDLTIDPKCNNIVQIIVEHAPLLLQKAMVKFWKLNTSDENEHKIKLLLEMHLQRHLAKIKEVIALQNSQQETARDLACEDITALLDQVIKAQKFNDLDQKLQSAIKGNIEGKLGMT